MPPSWACVVKVGSKSGQFIFSVLVVGYIALRYYSIGAGIIYLGGEQPF
jgi:hypothetical protein